MHVLFRAVLESYSKVVEATTEAWTTSSTSSPTPKTASDPHAENNTSAHEVLLTPAVGVSEQTSPMPPSTLVYISSASPAVTTANGTGDTEMAHTSVETSSSAITITQKPPQNSTASSSTLNASEQTSGPTSELPSSLPANTSTTLPPMPTNTHSHNQNSTANTSSVAFYTTKQAPSFPRINSTVSPSAANNFDIGNLTVTQAPAENFETVTTPPATVNTSELTSRTLSLITSSVPANSSTVSSSLTAITNGIGNLTVSHVPSRNLTAISTPPLNASEHNSVSTSQLPQYLPTNNATVFSPVPSYQNFTPSTPPAADNVSELTSGPMWELTSALPANYSTIFPLTSIMDGVDNLTVYQSPPQNFTTRPISTPPLNTSERISDSTSHLPPTLPANNATAFLPMLTNTEQPYHNSTSSTSTAAASNIRELTSGPLSQLTSALPANYATTSTIRTTALGVGNLTATPVPSQNFTAISVPPTVNVSEQNLGPTSQLPATSLYNSTESSPQATVTQEPPPNFTISTPPAVVDTSELTSRPTSHVISTLPANSSTISLLIETTFGFGNLTVSHVPPRNFSAVSTPPVNASEQNPVSTPQLPPPMPESNATFSSPVPSNTNPPYQNSTSSTPPVAANISELTSGQMAQLTSALSSNYSTILPLTSQTNEMGNVTVTAVPPQNFTAILTPPTVNTSEQHSGPSSHPPPSSSTDNSTESLPYPTIFTQAIFQNFTAITPPAAVNTSELTSGPMSEFTSALPGNYSTVLLLSSITNGVGNQTATPVSSQNFTHISTPPTVNGSEENSGPTSQLPVPSLPANNSTESSPHPTVTQSPPQNFTAITLPPAVNTSELASAPTLQPASASRANSSTVSRLTATTIGVGNLTVLSQNFSAVWSPPVNASEPNSELTSQMPPSLHVNNTTASWTMPTTTEAPYHNSTHTTPPMAANITELTSRPTLQFTLPADYSTVLPLTSATVAEDNVTATHVPRLPPQNFTDISTPPTVNGSEENSVPTSQLPVPSLPANNSTESSPHTTVTQSPPQNCTTITLSPAVNISGSTYAPISQLTSALHANSSTVVSSLTAATIGVGNLTVSQLPPHNSTAVSMPPLNASQQNADSTSHMPPSLHVNTATVSWTMPTNADQNSTFSTPPPAANITELSFRSTSPFTLALPANYSTVLPLTSSMVGVGNVTATPVPSQNFTAISTPPPLNASEQHSYSTSELPPSLPAINANGSLPVPTNTEPPYENSTSSTPPAAVNSSELTSGPKWLTPALLVNYSTVSSFTAAPVGVSNLTITHVLSHNFTAISTPPTVNASEQNSDSTSQMPPATVNTSEETLPSTSQITSSSPANYSMVSPLTNTTLPLSNLTVNQLSSENFTTTPTALSVNTNEQNSVPTSQLAPSLPSNNETVSSPMTTYTLSPYQNSTVSTPPAAVDASEETLSPLYQLTSSSPVSPLIATTVGIGNVTENQVSPENFTTISTPPTVNASEKNPESISDTPPALSTYSSTVSRTTEAISGVSYAGESSYSNLSVLVTQEMPYVSTAGATQPPTYVSQALLSTSEITSSADTNQINPTNNVSYFSTSAVPPADSTGTQNLAWTSMLQSSLHSVSSTHGPTGSQSSDEPSASNSPVTQTVQQNTAASSEPATNTSSNSQSVVGIQTPGSSRGTTASAIGPSSAASFTSSDAAQTAAVASDGRSSSPSVSVDFRDVAASADSTTATSTTTTTTTTTTSNRTFSLHSLGDLSSHFLDSSLTRVFDCYSKSTAAVIISMLDISYTLLYVIVSIVALRRVRNRQLYITKLY